MGYTWIGDEKTAKVWNLVKHTVSKQAYSTIEVWEFLGCDLWKSDSMTRLSFNQPLLRFAVGRIKPIAGSNKKGHSYFFIRYKGFLLNPIISPLRVWWNNRQDRIRDEKWHEMLANSCPIDQAPNTGGDFCSERCKQAYEDMIAHEDPELVQ